MLLKYVPPSIGDEETGFAVRVRPSTAKLVSKKPDVILAKLLEFADADDKINRRLVAEKATDDVSLRLDRPTFRKIDQAARRIGLTVGAAMDALAAELTTK